MTPSTYPCVRGYDADMREQDAVFLAYLPITFLLYVLFSGRYLSISSGREPPRALRASIEHVFRDQPTARKALGVYIWWTAMFQLPPFLMALSDGPGYLRVASLLEVAAALAWTSYLRLRPAS